MTDTTSSQPWDEAWMKAQQQYWEAWAALCKLNPGQETPAGAWTQTLDQWWKAAGVPHGSREVYERFVDQGRNFFRVGEVITGFLDGIDDTAKASDEWKGLLRRRFDELKKLLVADPTLDLPGTLKGLLSFCQLPADTLNRLLAGATALPGDFLQNLRSDLWDKAADHVHERVDKFLSVPGVGYTRESQEQNQALVRLLIDYQRALHEYTAAHGGLAADTLDRLYKKIIELADEGEHISSLRQVYDLWVDCGEEAYAEFVMSAEYAKVYGEFINALMAVKHHLRMVLDEQLGALNMPTRRELDTVLKRQQELRRSLRALESRVDGGGQGPRRGSRSDEEPARSAEPASPRREAAAAREKVTPIRARTARKAGNSTAKPATKPAVKPAARSNRAPSPFDIGSIATLAATDPSPASRRKKS